MLQEGKKLLMIVSAVALLSACSKERDLETRHFRMGFTAVSPELVSAVPAFSYRQLAHQADVVNYHLDGGVPWQESLDSTDFDAHLIADWNFRKSQGAPGQKIYVSVTPMNPSHNGLAGYWGARGNMPLPAPWNSYRFDDRPVKDAYLNYCRRVIDFFHPDYFAMSIESNLLYLSRPELWSHYLELHEYVYHELKSLYPDLPIFSSVAAAPLLNGYIKGNDFVQQRLAAVQVLALSDYFAVTLYPPQGSSESNSVSEQPFDELFSLSSKRIAVAETGYLAGKVPVDDVRGLPALPADAVGQAGFLDGLLAASEKWRAEFVIWSSLASYTGAVVSVPRLYNENDNLSPTPETWKEWLRRRVLQ